MITRHYDPTFAKHANVHQDGLQAYPTLAHSGAVEVRASETHGLGLHSTEPIPGRTVIGEYTGTIRTYADCDISWSMHTSKGLDFMIDASTSRRSCPVRFINDAEPALANCFCRELYANGRVFIISKMAIPARTELLFYYGPEYDRTWLSTVAQ
jgi:hypothetical protein